MLSLHVAYKESLFHTTTQPTTHRPPTPAVQLSKYPHQRHTKTCAARLVLQTCACTVIRRVVIAA